MEKQFIKTFDYYSPKLGELLVVSRHQDEVISASILPKTDDFGLIAATEPEFLFLWDRNENPDIMAKAFFAPYARYLDNQNAVHIHALATNPKLTQNGLARDLVQFIAQNTDPKTFPIMTATVCNMPEGLAERTAFFENLGFAQSNSTTKMGESRPHFAPIEKLRVMKNDRFILNPELSLL